jgi:tripartite-type tricarboxylate transporter receptor subunit TctC
MLTRSDASLTIVVMLHIGAALEYRGGYMMRFARWLALTAVLLCAAQPAMVQPTLAQDYPNKLIRILVGFVPGGGADLVARDIATRLQDTWGQSVIVENRGGANGTVATAALAKSPPDGYTLMLTLSSHITNPMMYSNLSYDVNKDIVPVSLVSAAPLVMVANPKFEVSDVKSLIALAKQKPGEVHYSTPGTGSIHHLSMELLNSLSGIKLVQVPYRGGGPSVTDVIGNQIPMTISSTVQILQLVQNKTLKPLAVTSAKRTDVLPDVPTFAEQGVGGYESELWFGLIAPAGTPAAVVTKINREVDRIVQSPDMRQRIASQGARPIGGTPQEFAAYLDREQVKWATIFKEISIKPE